MKRQVVTRAGAVAMASLLGWFSATAHGFQEPRERSGCVVASMRRVVPGAKDSAAPLSVEGLVLRLRTRKTNLDYRIASGPILDPIWDAHSRRIFWISHEEVCEIRVGSSKARSVYQERGFSGIGRIWISQDTLMIRGGSKDSCTALRLTKHGDTRIKLRCHPQGAMVLSTDPSP